MIITCKCEAYTLVDVVKRSFSNKILNNNNNNNNNNIESAYFGYFPPEETFKLFDAMVQPIVCYASPVWGYQPYICIERVHVNFCKRLGGLNKSVFALSECGRYPLYVNYMSPCIKYWLSLITMDGQRYPKQCYIMLRRLQLGGRLTWCSKVKNMFQYGFDYAWVANEVGNEKVFLAIFKQRLKDCSYQIIHSDVHTSAKSIY